jgi:hypothetical protein
METGIFVNTILAGLNLEKWIENSHGDVKCSKDSRLIIPLCIHK